MASQGKYRVKQQREDPKSRTQNPDSFKDGWVSTQSGLADTKMARSFIYKTSNKLQLLLASDLAIKFWLFPKRGKLGST